MAVPKTFSCEDLENYTIISTRTTEFDQYNQWFSWMIGFTCQCRRIPMEAQFGIPKNKERETIIIMIENGYTHK